MALPGSSVDDKTIGGPREDAGRRSLGERLRQARNSRGLTLRAAASALQVSPATWSAVENGRTGLRDDRLHQAAALYGVTVEDLADAPVRTEKVATSWRDFPANRLPVPLGAALEAFVEVGYHGATIRDIAGRAGLSVPGVYHYWPTKQHLLVALLDVTMDDLLSRARAARAERDGPVERFAALVECLALYHTHRRELGFVGASEMRSVDEPDRSRIAAARTEMQRMVDDEVVEGCRREVMRTERPHEAARTVVTMCTALPQWWSPAGSLSPTQVAAMYVEFAVDVVRASR